MDAYGDEPGMGGGLPMIYNLVYCSRATAGVDDAVVSEIIASSRRHNPARGITGMLVFGGGIFFQWLEGIRGRDWATISAVIDVVSVVEQTAETRTGERVVGYLATLTYFYRNPELQMGEYSRMFGEEAEAQAWTASYKGRNVMVHVDPRDFTHSVLRKEEL